MDKYYEKQTEALCYLNYNMIYPTFDVKSLAGILGIEFINEDDGWYIPDEF